MKTLILSLALVAQILIVTGCGNGAPEVATAGACKGIKTDLNGVSLEGTWVMTSGSNVNTLTLNENCAGGISTSQGSGTISSQHMKFTYGQPRIGAIPIHVTETTGGAFYPVMPGDYSCAYNDTTPGQMTVDCGGGAQIYFKQ